ncbi:hypothetical protein AXG93_685s1120 [Marchantia polymorpha subsp. ruderalis]|uniref:Phosphoadenosine phosphosulphate reductase domain-containing protein n=1 Tax=Marchantia polymorpha subsp. ruderalis TaxID=1480154 RepID=A0A176WG19_MARPO|nr:hypothetical protein AXG93_685s1120 [Marchantia polymorpha subsp. ruderalis]
MDSADEEPELLNVPLNTCHVSFLIEVVFLTMTYVERLMCVVLPIGSDCWDYIEKYQLPYHPLHDQGYPSIGDMQSTQRKEPEVIGNCNTLEVLDVRQICGRDRLRMTEMAFRGFMSSTNLREIIFYPIVWSSDEEIESLCLQLGGILYSSSVTRLRIGECGLSARCWLNLASGLRGNSKSKLEFLHLSNAWEDSSAVKHVADMINSAPRLQWLDLYSGLEMDDEAVGMLSQALIQSSSLECLNLDGVKWGAALFLKALAGDDGNRSIESLSLSLSLNGIDPLDGLGDCLRQLLTSNPSLKEVGLKCLRMRPEEWQQLGEVIRDNAIATHIHPEFRWEEDEEDEWKSIEALACAASSDVKDPIVYLDLTLPSYHDYVLSLNLLGRVLRGELKSLYFLSIKLGNYSPGKNKYLPPSNEDRLNGNTRETSVLKALLVEVENKDVWKYLLLCLRGNTSLTHLELSGFELDKESLRDLMGLLRGNTSLTHLDLCDLMYELDEESFRDLMGLLQVNLTLQDIYVDKITDGQEAQIEEALKQNQKRAEYMSVFREAKLEFEAAKAGRLFLCGSPLAGGLVALGQDFQAQDSGSSSRMMSTHSNASKDGFVSESDFHRLIKDFQQKQPHCVDRHVLEDILINLDLCFKVEDTSQYFIPSFIPEHASTEEHKPQELAWKTRDQTSKFVGIRIQCQDGTTMSLTAAFFPCFQMFMRRKLISEMNVSKKNVTCSRHYLRLFLDGYEVYVEQGTSHKYVDVLMLRSKHKSRSEALQYAMKHIVQELMSFCASSKGCPGVALVLGVIQTRCVEMLVPSDLRGAILIEELKSNFIRRINNKLEDIPPNMLLLVKEEELLNYEHSWPPIEGHTPVIFERARDLLWESDVEGVVNEIQQKCSQHLEPFRQALISVSNDLDQPYTESENRVGNPSNSDRLYRSNFLKLDERLRSVESVVQRMDMKLGQILTFHQEFPSRLSDLMSKMDRMIQYPESFQQARTPKRPYVTNDVGVLYRISAILHAGTTIRLYLMCESMTGFHKVKDQEGLNIRLDKENLTWLRKTIEISCKVVYYAVKAGLERTLNLSSMIPDWKDLELDIVKLDSISDRDRRAVLKGGESMELKEAWLRIQQTLAPQLRDSYSAKFKLFQVKYVSLELGGHAWVCEECMHKAWVSSANSLSKAVHSKGIDLKAVVEEIDKFLDVLPLRSGMDGSEEKGELFVKLCGNNATTQSDEIYAAVEFYIPSTCPQRSTRWVQAEDIRLRLKHVVYAFPPSNSMSRVSDSKPCLSLPRS